jgi:Asp-tRNA(Asn)/Glu-tRNA(Gln) amidotransferase A subunit family amidase
VGALNPLDPAPPWALTIAEAARRLAAGELTSTALTTSVLDRATATEPAVQAYVTLLRDPVLEAAERADAELRRGHRRGPLHGIPISIKDTIDVAGMPTTAGSPVRAGHIAGADATVTRRLVDAGAIPLGKTVPHAWAFGVESPPTRTPWDTTRIPGGSSGGSAASVAAGSSLASIGGDTGGSIRLPAAFCGVVGLLPTYGRVSRRGAVPTSWSCDTIGPITRTVEDAALLHAVIAGPDPLDPATVTGPAPASRGALDQGVVGLRLGVPRNHFFDVCDREVERRVRDAIAVLEAQGAELVDVELPLVEHGWAALFVIALVEAATYHRRAVRELGALYGAQAQAVFGAGGCLFAADYVDAQRVRALVRAASRRAFDEHRLDGLLTPAVPVVAPVAGEAMISVDDGPEQPLAPVLARTLAVFSLTGQPALSVPCGFVDGLPVGLQIVGRPFEDDTVLRVGRTYEAVTDWHRRQPML